MTTLYVWDADEIELRDMQIKYTRDIHDMIPHYAASGLARLMSDHAAGCDIDVILYGMVASLVLRLSQIENRDEMLDYLARHGRDVMMASIERVRDGHG